MHSVMCVCVCVCVCRYPEFAPMFKAELWDPDEWANLFKEAGAKCRPSPETDSSVCVVLVFKSSVFIVVRYLVGHHTT